MPMPRSKPPTPAPGERTTVRESGDLLLVESPTAEEALERLSSLLGPDVEIVAAEKVTRGGLGIGPPPPPSTVTALADRPGSEAPSLLPSAPAHLAVLDAFWATDGAAPVPEDPGPLLQEAGPEAPPAPPEPSGIAVAEPTVVLAPLSAMPAPVLFDPVQETESLRPGDPPGTGDPLGTGDPPGTGGVAW